MSKLCVFKCAVTACALMLLTVVAQAQRITSLTATAKGHGELAISDTDKRKISAVTVILKEGGEAHITIFADLQLSAMGRWAESDNAIDLTITGGIVEGNATGTGKLVLRDDRKSISSLTIDAKSTTGGTVKVEFVAEEKASEPEEQTSAWIPLVVGN